MFECDSLLNITVIDTGHTWVSGMNLYFLSVEYYSISTLENDSVFLQTDTIYERFGSLNYSSFLSLQRFCSFDWLDIEYYKLCNYRDNEFSLVSTCPTIIIGIDEKNREIANIFPNPVNDILNIGLQDILRNAEIRIQNLNGQKVFKSRIENQKTSIDVSSFANGIYFLTISNSEKTATMKMVVQH